MEWRPPLDDGGVELERYTIEKCEADKKIWTKVGDVDKEVESFCAQKLQQDVDYMFRIVARNAVGPSEALESEPIRTRISFGKTKKLIVLTSLSKKIFGNYMKQN